MVTRVDAEAEATRVGHANERTASAVWMAFSCGWGIGSDGHRWSGDG